MKSTTTAPADLLILGTNGAGIAAVDVKNPRGLSREFAKEYRRDVYLPGQSFHLPYYLLASQDVGFLWQGPGVGDPDADPAAEIPLSQVVRHYSPELAADERLRPWDLELLYFQWLFGIAEGISEARELLGDLSHTPCVARFIQDIEGARIVMAEHR